MGGGKGARDESESESAREGGREDNEEVHCRVGRPAENSSPASRARGRVPRSVVRRRFLARLPTQSVSGLAAEERNVIRSPSCEVDANPVGGGGMGKGGSEGDDSLSCELTKKLEAWKDGLLNNTSNVLPFWLVLETNTNIFLCLSSVPFTHLV